MTEPHQGAPTNGQAPSAESGATSASAGADQSATPPKPSTAARKARAALRDWPQAGAEFAAALSGVDRSSAGIGREPRDAKLGRPPQGANLAEPMLRTQSRGANPGNPNPRGRA